MEITKKWYPSQFSMSILWECHLRLFQLIQTTSEGNRTPRPILQHGIICIHMGITSTRTEVRLIDLITIESKNSLSNNGLCTIQD